MKRAGWLAAVVAVAVSVVVAGCGIPAENDPSPVVLPAPYNNVATTSAPPPTTDEGPLTKVLYMIRDSRLVAVTRPVDAVPDLMALVDDLTAGPTAAEREMGLASALAAGTAIVQDVEIAGGLASVSLTDGGLEGLTGSTQQLAIAQIVCTLDAREEVTGVVFVRAGVRIPVPRGDGSQSDAELTMADYLALVEPT